MATKVHQLAIVSESESVTMSDLTRVSAALQKQAIRDLGPIWEVEATVDAFAKLEDIPLGYWPMVVRDDIGFDAAGIHLDQDGQPFALISAGDNWSLTASHETLEMLVDPFGNELFAGDSPKPDQGRVEFLVEVSDPSEAAEFGYTINGILMSDFYTPRFFDPVVASGVRYSFTGAITEPRDVLRGGYLSWKDPVTDEWWQETWFSGAASTFRSLGKLTNKTSLRSQIDKKTTKESLHVMRRQPVDVAGGGPTLFAAAQKPQASGLTSAIAQKSAYSKAEAWRAEIAALIGGKQQETPAAKEAPTGRRRPPGSRR